MSSQRKVRNWAPRYRNSSFKCFEKRTNVKPTEPSILSDAANRGRGLQTGHGPPITKGCAFRDNSRSARPDAVEGLLASNERLDTTRRWHLPKRTNLMRNPLVFVMLGVLVWQGYSAYQVRAGGGEFVDNRAAARPAGRVEHAQPLSLRRPSVLLAEDLLRCGRVPPCQLPRRENGRRRRWRALREAVVRRQVGSTARSRAAQSISMGGSTRRTSCGFPMSSGRQFFRSVPSRSFGCLARTSAPRITATSESQLAARLN